MKKFQFLFHGRTLGAIGYFHTIGPFEGVGANVEDAREDALVKAYEHHDLYITIPVGVKEVKDESSGS